MKMVMVVVFSICGAILWILGGFMTAMICFEPTISLEQMQANKELATQVCNSWGGVQWKVAGTWSLIGGLVGAIVSIIFLLRPEHEFYTRMPNVSGLPGAGPKTLAETHTTFLSVILAVVVAICAMSYVLPMFQTEIIVLSKETSRQIGCAIMAVITTVPILPFSIKFLNKME